MVGFAENLEEFWNSIFFSEVPGAIRASKCQQENEAYPEQPVSILSKPIVISDCFDTFESIYGVLRIFWGLLEVDNSQISFLWP